RLNKDSPLQKDIESIGKEITRSAEILRSYAETDGSEDPGLAKTDVNGTIEDVISVFKGSNRNIRFNVDLDDTITPVNLNTEDLKQILVNIIKNAVECFEGFKQYGNKSKITLSTNSSVNINGKQYVEIVISDNGPGLPEEIKSGLFQPNITTKGPDHSGLGLSIVRELIDKMEGMISCKTGNSNESTPGTTFSIYIRNGSTPD
ncbi:MAG: ATP-binding protein, partial [Proteobacteria bacterium]|nr:ATP-binding protein [Pseudomonadota bacterium]